MDTTIIMVNALKLVLLDTTENVKKEFARNVMKLVLFALTVLQLIVENALKDSTSMVLAVLKRITVQMEPSPIQSQENVHLAQLNTVLIA